MTYSTLSSILNTKSKRTWKLISNLCIRNYCRILFPIEGSRQFSANRDLNLKTLRVSRWTCSKNTSLCFSFWSEVLRLQLGGLRGSRCSVSRQDSQHLMLQVIEAKQVNILAWDSMLSPLYIPRLSNSTAMTLQGHSRSFSSCFLNPRDMIYKYRDVRRSMTSRFTNIRIYPITLACTRFTLWNFGIKRHETRNSVLRSLVILWWHES
jgi:hypothetical protein